MLGVQTILTGGWEYDDIFVPPGFLDNAWNLFLPKGSSSVLLSVMCYVFQGYAKEKLLEHMNTEEKELSLTPFRFEPMDTNRKEEQWIYHRTFERETEVKMILERSGFLYPQNIEEFITLFIHIGIIYEVRYQGTLFFDIVIEPFPYPESNLQLTTQEKEMMLQHQRMITNLNW